MRDRFHWILKFHTLLSCIKLGLSKVLHTETEEITPSYFSFIKFLFLSIGLCYRDVIKYEGN